MEKTALAPGAFIMPTTRYETHPLGSANPSAHGASAEGTTFTEGHYHNPPRRALLPLLVAPVM